MILSQTAVYALRALLQLAETEESRVPVGEIAETLGVPGNYLSKILHVLARADLLDSTRGPQGGFELARPPEEIFLSEVVEHFDDIVHASGCLLSRAECSDENPCPAHHRWKEVSLAVRAFLSETTVGDLAHGDRSGQAVVGDLEGLADDG